MLFASGAQRSRLASGISEYPLAGVYAANSPVISYSDCVQPTFENGWMKFRRPIDDVGFNYQYAMPGARMRFRSNAPSVTVYLRWNGLVTAEAHALVGHVFIDGAWYSDWQTPAAVNVVTTNALTLNLGSSADRLYEIILPYGDGVEFGSVQINPSYVVTAAAARTGNLMVCLGDSITEGWSLSNVKDGWVFRLAEAKGFRAINMGFASRVTVPEDGTAVAGLNPDLLTVLLGTNDYLNQVPVATYKANLKQLLINFNALKPSVPVYLSAPIPCLAGRTIPFSSYVAVAGQCISELGYAQLHSVTNTSLITDPSTQLEGGGVHPIYAGATQMVTGWSAAIP